MSRVVSEEEWRGVAEGGATLQGKIDAAKGNGSQGVAVHVVQDGVGYHDDGTSEKEKKKSKDDILI